MKRLRIIFILLAILLIGVLVIYLVQPKEPEYQGRKLSTWIRVYQEQQKSSADLNLADPNRAVPMTAAERAIKEIGTNALPTLLRWLQIRDSTLKTKLNSLLERQSFIKLRYPPASRMQDMAIAGLRILGTNALPAVPNLTQFVRSADTNSWDFIWISSGPGFERSIHLENTT